MKLLKTLTGEKRPDGVKWPDRDILAEPCPRCDEPMIAEFEPNGSDGITVHCTVCRFQNHIAYRQLHNFAEVTAERLISGDEVNFDHHFKPGHDDQHHHYFQTPPLVRPTACGGAAQLPGRSNLSWCRTATSRRTLPLSTSDTKPG